MIDGDQISEALCAQLRLLYDVPPGAWWATRDTALAGVAGVDLAGFNTVTPRAAPARADEVSELLDLVADTGLPHCLQVRPRDAGRIDPLARARGMRFIDGLPFYALEGRAKRVRTSALEMRPLKPEQAVVHAVVAGVGFGLDRSLFETLVTPELLQRDGVCAYVATDGGAAVATGLRLTIGPASGIINVTTLPEMRGRGYALALTQLMVADGLADGARFSFLASTPEGVGIYERLGFSEVERWGCWESS